MASIKFIQAGLMTSVQDLGRPGLMYYAIPNSGALNPSFAQEANLLAGNPIDAPVIECIMTGPVIEYQDRCRFAICGADMGWLLDGMNIKPGQSYDAIPGSILQSRSTNDMKTAYISVEGILQCQSSFNSSSSYHFAGLGAHSGQRIKKHQFLEFTIEPEEHLIQLEFRPSLELVHVLNIQPGPEFNIISSEGIDTLFNTSFRITPNSNRMGSKLQGQPVDHKKMDRMGSVPLLPGFIQLLPSGQLVVILQDGQTTGGYPRIGYLKKIELERFNAMPLGYSFDFSKF
ncbi:MAG: hypothetical protein HKN67_13740 [Saprospiraceae bacterium]|nr:hypothetical protein [Bacteroidia bacterium]MBT8228719.1 hypothetical protein [Bacteroidia bacterium]NNF22996.1 hypothetical protein [Saprospiraceae bacterium]NNK89188.1 hypothetical protein [Saprospiraceae bacterium]